MSTDVTRRRYLDDAYAEANPTWDAEDAPWKAGLVADTLRRQGLEPRSVVEVGCGSGQVLVELARRMPATRFTGYDIAPRAAEFWKKHAAAGIEFRVADFLADGDGRYDVLLLLDVIEHVGDPHAMLAGLRNRAAHHVLHIPLDLSALTTLREKPLLHQRATVGHIHYYTKGLALALLDECGYEVVEWRYTGAAAMSPHRTWKTRLARLPRAAAYALDKDWGVRLLGGETLIVLAQPRPD